MKRWKKIKTQESYQCGNFYRVDKDKVSSPGGKEVDYFVIRKEPSVMIVPVDGEGFIHMTIQHRYPTSKYSLELPGGHAKSGEEEMFRYARLELEEEMGLRSDEWSLVGTFDEANGIAEMLNYVLLANNVYTVENPKKDSLDKDLHESVKYTFAEIKTMIAEGEITDANSITPLMIAGSQKLIG